MSVIAVAALSARMLAEAAVRDGLDVIALDLFGDLDTRRACTQWLPVGAPGALRIDRDLLLEALAGLARRGDVMGWVPGSGLEGDADLLEQGARLLPLLGTAASDVRRVRDPRQFFAALDASGIAHPDVQQTEPNAPHGWLSKDMAGCGGWHIRPAAQAPGRSMPPSGYFQREWRGVPMSATFLANGNDAVVLGHNRLIVGRIGVHPFAFRGVIGPVPLAAPAARRVGTAVRSLAAAFSLRGLCSLDFLLDGDTVFVLEINPRPPASMALYADRGGILTAHLRACMEHELPARVPDALTVQGTEIVFARRSLRVGEAAARQLAAWPGCHDLPAAGSSVAGADPVCSVSASGMSAAEVEAQLARSREALLAALENQ